MRNKRGSFLGRAVIAHRALAALQHFNKREKAFCAASCFSLFILFCLLSSCWMGFRRTTGRVTMFPKSRSTSRLAKPLGLEHYLLSATVLSCFICQALWVVVLEFEFCLLNYLYYKFGSSSSEMSVFDDYSGFLCQHKTSVFYHSRCRKLLLRGKATSLYCCFLILLLIFINPLTEIVVWTVH